MKWEEIAQLPRETILALLRDALENMVRIDGYWFVGVEKLAGTERAVAVDEQVWSRFGRHEAEQVKRNFGLTSDGISVLVRGLRLAPSWTLWGDYRVEQTSDREAVLQVLSCYSQKERLKAGLGVFNCKGVEGGYFASFAKVIDPRIQVHCAFCPPAKYFDNLWCEWHFELEDERK